MSNITKCDNRKCPSRGACARYVATPVVMEQQYFVQLPELNAHGTCKYFMPYDLPEYDVEHVEETVLETKPLPKFQVLKFKVYAKNIFTGVLTVFPSTNYHKFVNIRSHDRMTIKNGVIDKIMGYKHLTLRKIA